MPESAVDIDDQPVFNPSKLRLETAPIRRLRDQLHRWLWTGATGAVVTGPSRVGKTIAMSIVSSQIYTRGGIHVPSISVSMVRRDGNTIASVFRNLCQQVELPVQDRHPADYLADRFIHFATDQAVEAHCPQLVLIIDEIQRLTPRQFDAFAEIYDALSRLQIELLMVLIGNDLECLPLIESIQAPEYSHIHGRFFTHQATFSGLRSKAEVRECLEQYDTLRYPSDGPTYTEYFLPEAFKRGWRLASLSGDLWATFRDYQKQYMIPSWGMQYFTATVNVLLSDFLHRDGVNAFNDDMADQCIQLSGLIPSLVRPSQ